MIKYSQLPLALILTYWTLKQCAMSPYPWIFLDHANLFIHEFGHIAAAFLPSRLLVVLTGTVVQLMIPALVLGYFFLKEDRPGLLFSTFWLGNNFIHVGVYMKDAQEQLLPLFGLGPDPSHDWAYIFGQFNQVAYADYYANPVLFMGYALCIGATIAAWRACWYDKSADKRTDIPIPRDRYGSRVVGGYRQFGSRV